MRTLRCAIYTRVSTEHGLEQEFNSLENQREAAEAYVKSQAHGRAMTMAASPAALWTGRPCSAASGSMG
ncbi:MAG: hin 5 [Microvirga sp.]|jgi:hypothetical protein|nr:hin 5 [Microvirga sp.]MDF2973043.1 hin 5 [Microvirga sp.]